MKPKVAHIIVTDKCGHNCPMCCNRNYDIHEIPNITREELESVETICLTGGEPFMSKDIDMFIDKLRPYAKNLYVYASGAELYNYWKKNNKVPNIDGLSISPKTMSDYRLLIELLKNDCFRSMLRCKSNRLYIFIKQIDPANFQTEEEDFDAVLGLIILAQSLFNVFFRVWKDEIVSPEGEIFRNINFEELGI